MNIYEEGLNILKDNKSFVLASGHRFYLYA